jgi:AcrR family transcriptional regulator
MRSNSVRQPSSRRARVDPEAVRAKVLDAFSNKAKRYGIRALLMTELAAELRMSATTLYKLFPSKEALALACVDRWADELGAAEQVRAKKRSGLEGYLDWVDAWADANAALSPAFAHDLKTDYPAVWKRYRDVLEERKRIGAQLLRPHLKPGVNERVAFALLNMIFSAVVQPEFADRLHISRREALRSSVSVWATGALAPTRRAASAKR